MKIILGNLLIALILIEFFSALYLIHWHEGVLNSEKDPTYLNCTLGDQYEFRADPGAPHLIDSLYPWTTWHPRNVTFRHTASCFDVEMRFNKMGTRGTLPDPADSTTILFLGDSFVEGYGLEEDSTVAERFHRSQHLPVLNLGCSSLGTTQMSLLYEQFGNQFRHQTVVTFLFLQNDFEDNDVRRFEANRYKPYRRMMEYGESEIRYSGHPEHTKWSWAVYKEHQSNQFKTLKRYGLRSILSRSPGGLIRGLINLFYARRLVGYISSCLKGHTAIPPDIDYSNEDLRILLADIESIQRTAMKQGAATYFCNLPSRILLDFVSASEENLSAYRDFECFLANAIADKGGQYVSFLEFLLEHHITFNRLFFACDNHYSNDGNALLAQFIEEVFSTTEGALCNLGR